MMPLSTAYARRDSNASSEASYGSYHSRSTAPTDYSCKPSLRHFDTDISRIKVSSKTWDDCFCDDAASRLSVDSYASTVASDLEEEAEEPEESEELQGTEEVEHGYEAPPEVHYSSRPPTAYASTPTEFAEYFPSTRRLCIRHDDTIDGNMNLRIDTETHTESGGKVDLTLFHLRMRDLKRREFSFRRYCRDSGREICHSSRKYNKTMAQRRPAFQRSVSSALASLKSMTGDKVSPGSFKRYDSGYGSLKHDEDTDAASETLKLSSSKNLPIPTNTTMLEFSNYLHVELKRRGAKSSKRYDFKYWGTSYVWRRTARKLGPSKEISYQLFASNSSTPIAHVVPEPMSPYEAEMEERKGGWIAPHSLWLSDPNVVNAHTDIAE